MTEITATPTWAYVAYLAAAVCFILALKGLSSPRTARRGNTGDEDRTKACADGSALDSAFTGRPGWKMVGRS